MALGDLRAADGYLADASTNMSPEATPFTGLLFNHCDAATGLTIICRIRCAAPRGSWAIARARVRRTMLELE